MHIIFFENIGHKYDFENHQYLKIVDFPGHARHVMKWPYLC